MYQKGYYNPLLAHIGPTPSNGHKTIDNIFFLHMQENILLNKSDQAII
jgi:hypothetical protein